ncbi:TPA: hypothetical protein QE959_002103 [Staphylococcus aureus]|nr:hypothetical protein [Staphylococcus aureus]HDA2810659.1 hypothetical protein [Staphylococcus aureus]HDF3555664.1 hypothetical protein [Staphylococcus aureus]HDP6143225.1 hypothetical protein [Staphylococcus aureus]HDT6952234.1 hypothetical protein [Staphylococcus aureus]HDT6957585.1 hypothetical protein [Staphylococcus aureus]
MQLNVNMMKFDRWHKGICKQIVLNSVEKGGKDK